MKQAAPFQLPNTNIISHSFYTQSAFRFCEFYGHVSLVPVLDEMMESIETLRDMGDSHHLALRQITSKGQFPISGRDFLVVTYATTLKDGRIVIATRSVNVANIAPLEGYVRANNYISGYIIEEFKEADGKVYCVATLLAHADLAGHIPAAIINRLGTSSTVKVLEKLESIVTTKTDSH